MAALRVLRRPGYLVAMLVMTVILAALYYNFDLRSAGVHTTIFTTTKSTPDFEMKTFGSAYFYATIALDVMMALITSALVMLTVANFRARRKGAAAGSVGSVASFAVAATTFG